MTEKKNNSVVAEKNIYDSSEYKRSRYSYFSHCACEYFISILVSDAYLAKLLIDVGVSDKVIGIISSLITAAFLFQLSSIFIAEKIKNIKRTATIFSTLSQLLFTSLYLVPFLPLSTTLKTVIIFGAIILAYFALYSVTSIIYKWGYTFVAPNKFGSFSASNEMISLCGGIVFTLCAGMVIDKLEAVNRLHAAFIFIAISGLILSICNFVCLRLIANSGESEDEKAPNLKEVLKYISHNKGFIRVIILSCLWSVGRYFTVGFMGTYKTKELLLTVSAIQIINIVGCVGRIAISKPFGKFADRTSFAHGIKIALVIGAVAFGLNVFTSPSTIGFLIAYAVLYEVSIAGTNANFYNVVYSYVEPKYFVSATAIKNSISGILGFIASLLGSFILDVVQKNGNTLFGINVYGQQVLSFISFTIIVIAAIYTHIFIDKKEKTK